MNTPWILYLCFLLCYLSAHLQEELVTPLPQDLNESSGLIALDSVFLSINDSGNSPTIYVFDQNGVLLNKCLVANAVNIDWEALALGENGKVYVGDFGNNKNDRRDLTIYKVNLADVLASSTVNADKITFEYPDQTSFPPEKENFNFDAEGMVFHGDSLFVFTKNRSNPYTGVVNIYMVPNTPGHHSAKLYSSISLPNNTWFENSVTDVCMNMDSIYILTYRYLYVFHSLNTPVLLETIEFTGVSQKEGVSYRNGALYITSEKNFLGAARLYKINYPK
jgi:hypothetical protein